MREFRAYYSVVTWPVTTATDVTSMCHYQPPDPQPGTGSGGAAAPATRASEPHHVPVTLLAMWLDRVTYRIVSHA
jgi:hypothetical protein